MKSWIGGVLFFCLLAAAGAAFAATTIGVIDVQRVFRDYKNTQSAQDKLAQKEKDLKKKLEESQEKIDKARREGKSAAELESLTKKLENELEPKRKELQELNQTLTSQIQASIVTAVQDVSKNLGIDMVLDKQIVITGGVDLTEMVTKQLNTK